MSFLDTLIQKSKQAVGYVVILGVFNSLLNGGLLMFINSTIAGKPFPVFPEYNWVVFIVIVTASLICSRYFQAYMIRLTNNILFDFELTILTKLRHASYEDFEALGNEKVYTAINDTKVLAHAPEVFMNAFNAFIVILCCFGYLFWISPLGAGFVLVVMAALLVFYIVRNKAIEADLNRQRDLQNVYYKHLEDLLHGFKELKMSITRNLAIFDNFLIKNREAGRNISISTSVKYMDNELIGGYSWYIVMGITMFVLPAVFHLDIAKTSAFLITILYLIGPIAIILTLVPTYTAVKISVQRLNVFDSMLDALDSHATTSVKLADESFDSIRFEGVSYRYDKGKEQGFHLEPFDLEIQRGEIVFVTGGNGSGKSTFGYLLSGLYRPYAGKIYLNDREINDASYVHYSDRLSAVFTTNYLFNDNYDGFELTTANAQLLEYIELMDMGKILKLDGEQKTLGKKYSKGQQKRLALIYALLENKEVIILDEWAAEQDPRFRRYFYQEVLPILKEKGKTVIAITHDDDYYDCATRIIKFNYGKIVNDSPVYAGKVVEN